MNLLNRQSWEIYIDYYNLTDDEINNHELCEELRGSYHFAHIRLAQAVRNLFEEILKAFTGKRNV